MYMYLLGSFLKVVKIKLLLVSIFQFYLSLRHIEISHGHYIYVDGGLFVGPMGRRVGDKSVDADVGRRPRAVSALGEGPHE